MGDRDACMPVLDNQEIETICVPVQSPDPPHAVSMASFPILHPHRVLAYLFNDVGIQVSSSEVREFWEHSRAVGEPWSLESPATAAHIPLGIHGDAARLWTQYKHEKVVAIWLNVLHFRPASVRHSRYLLFSCPHNVMVKNRTLNRVWRRLVWSLEAAFDGINPVLGEGGKPLSGHDLHRAGTPLTPSGQRFALVELRGDWEWHVSMWRPAASWVSLDTCFKCPARSKGCPGYLYHNVGPTSEWLRDEFTHHQFISRRLKDKNLCNLTVASCHCVIYYKVNVCVVPLFGRYIVSFVC